MQRVCTVLIGMFLAMGLVTGAQAQTVGGEQELGLLASFFKDTDSDSDGFVAANVRYGLFVTQAIQVGGGLEVFGAVDNIDESIRYELFGTYYFSPAEVNTFYTRGGYFAPLDDPGQGFLDGAFGFKTYINERAAFFWEGGYGFGIGSDVDGGVVRTKVGITFLF